MNNKILLAIVLGISIMIILGIYSYQTSAINIKTIKSVSYSEKLMPNFQDPEISSSHISNAEDKINEVEVLLNQVKQKDISEYDFLHRKFLENTIDLVEKKFKESKDKLDIAKEAFQNEEYSKAGENAYLSRVISSTLPRHLNNILEGRKKDEWNRETAIMEDDSTPTNPPEIPVDEDGEPIRNVTPPSNPSDYPSTSEEER